MCLIDCLYGVPGYRWTFVPLGTCLFVHYKHFILYGIVVNVVVVETECRQDLKSVGTVRCGMPALLRKLQKVYHYFGLSCPEIYVIFTQNNVHICFLNNSSFWESFTLLPPDDWICPCSGGIVVRVLDMRLTRSQVRLVAIPLSGNNAGQVVHAHVPLSSSSIIWYRSGDGDALQLGR